jgi:hypothetical protein
MRFTKPMTNRAKAFDVYVRLMAFKLVKERGRANATAWVDHNMAKSNDLFWPRVRALIVSM